MPTQLHRAAWNLVERARTAGQRGWPANPQRLYELSRSKVPFFPAWYLEILTTVPLCGLEVGYGAHGLEAETLPSEDGNLWMCWSDAGQMEPELECYPWCEIIKGGYLNVASDEAKSGNPYFISTRQGADPPLYRVHHEIYRLNCFDQYAEQVAPSLSEFFNRCLVRTHAAAPEAQVKENS
jgi:hypothetical protein